MTAQETLVKMSLAGGITIALLVGIASAAVAEPLMVVKERPDQEAVSERVSYLDLDLASADGAKRLNYRVRGAVRRVCAPLQGFPELGQMRCESSAWKGAKPQIELAVTRAQEIAANGTSSIAPVAIVIATGR